MPPILMLIALIPIPTAVLAQAFSRRSSEAVAAAFYGSTLTLLGILINVMWRYAGDHVDREAARRIGRHFFIGPAGHAIGVLVALVVPWAALTLYLLLNVFHPWPRRKEAGPNPA